MTRDHCARAVTSEAGQIDAVTGVSIDLSTGVVETSTPAD
jgi:copper chaperone CopZ